jgi:hypothetical protein
MKGMSAWRRTCPAECRVVESGGGLPREVRRSRYGILLGLSRGAGWRDGERGPVRRRGVGVVLLTLLLIAVVTGWMWKSSAVVESRRVVFRLAARDFAMAAVENTGPNCKIWRKLSAVSTRRTFYVFYGHVVIISEVAVTCVEVVLRIWPKNFGGTWIDDSSAFGVGFALKWIRWKAERGPCTEGCLKSPFRQAS